MDDVWSRSMTRRPARDHREDGVGQQRLDLVHGSVLAQLGSGVSGCVEVFEQRGKSPYGNPGHLGGRRAGLHQALVPLGLDTAAQVADHLNAHWRIQFILPPRYRVTI